jgi:NAD(P)-dependent dehydrogenase (short-subunit alcohol dehydrogenase family)
MPEDKKQPPAQQQKPPGTTRAMSPKPDHGEESYRGAGRLEGKAALITGADSGIGRAVAIAFAREGADVAISYLSEHEDAEETAEWVRKAGRKALLLPGDIKDETFCAEMVSRTAAEFGRLDCVVNNAAYQRSYAKIEDIETAEWQETFRTNVDAMFFICRVAVKHMKEGSTIINTTSIQSKDPSGPLLAYAATKGAILNFTSGLASMLAERGIRVNAVAPGPIWTPLIPSTLPEDKVEGFGSDTPLGRVGQPAELAGAYVLLASDQSSYMTGAVIPVTGGRPMI